jgi:hypothetical protein
VDNVAPSSAAPATAVGQSIEFTAPAQSGWAFQGWSVNADATIVSATPVTCFAGVTAALRYVLNYVPGPTKLAFITSPFTDIVGACMGPMQVQSQNAASAALAVTANTTVNLSSSGTGGFYTSAGCPTNGLASVQINAGQTNSAQFWYKPEAVGTGTHTITAAATGLTSATQDQTVNKAPSTIVYTGDVIVAAGNTLKMSALVTSDFAGCVAGRTVRFRIEPHPLYNPPGPGDPDQLGPAGLTATTNSSGVATLNLSTTGWTEGTYDIRVNVVASDDCLTANDHVALLVLSPGGAATGGGFLSGNIVGGGRVNFAFTVRQVPNSEPVAYKGQFLVMKQESGVPQWRCKGALTNYGVDNVAGVNYAYGTCDLQAWDPGLPDGGDWYVPYGDYTNRPVVIKFVDNGTGKGKNAPPPDQFGFEIDFPGGTVIPVNPSFGLLEIKGGDIDVKDSGGSTTTTEGTEETSPTKGGGKKK